MWGLAAKLVGDIFTSYQDGKNKKRELNDAKHERRIEVIREGNVAEATWNEKAIDNSGWKDEWLTLLLSAPLVLVFFPYMVPHVTAGFIALEGMPAWYQAGVALMISSAFGYQKFMNYKMMSAYTLP